MKTRLIITLAALPALAMLSPRPACAAVDVGVSAGVQINAPGVGIQIGSRNDFYAPLQPYGTWVNFQNYGRCFHPTGVAADWRPYCNGSWENTDAGWYWNSDEPFAWACYHYGSWYYDTSYGWVWIPGTDWAPAWVDWRDSDGYVGWAPCGPNRAVLDASFFVFCDIHHFHDHFSPRAVIINNREIINRTRVVNDFSRRSVDFNGRRETIFANKGPSVDVIQRATGTHFNSRPVADVWRENHDRRSENMRGNENRPENRNVRPEEQRQQEQNRNNMRPEEQQRQNNPPPTGTEQQRRYEQQQQQERLQQQQRQQEQQREVTPRNQTPAQHPSETPQTRPEQRPNMTPPATGHDQERIYHEPNAQAPDHGNNATSPKAEQRPAPAPEQRQAAPQERTLPPTGRENAPAQQHHPEAARPEQAPQQHAPADKEQDKNKDKQQP